MTYIRIIFPGSKKDFHTEKDLQQAVWAGILPMKFQWQIPQQVKEQDNADLPGLSFREWPPLIN